MPLIFRRIDSNFNRGSAPHAVHARLSSHTRSGSSPAVAQDPVNPRSERAQEHRPAERQVHRRLHQIVFNGILR